MPTKERRQVATETVGLDEPALIAAYRAETDRLVAQRLTVTVGLYLGLVGGAIVLDSLLHPERLRSALQFYAVHVAVSAAALLIVRLTRRTATPTLVAALLGCAWSILLTIYNAVFTGNPERIATALISLLSGLFVMLPWGWPPQLAVSVTSLVETAAVGLWLGPDERFVYAMVAIFTGTLTSVLGCFYLDRYRRDSFLRHAQVSRTSAEKQEEAEIAAALLHVSETLSRHLNEPELLVRIVRVAVEAVGCDWGSIFVREERGVFSLGGTFGAAPAVAEEMRAVEFSAENLPLVGVMQRGSLIAMPDVAVQDLVPPALLARWEVASQMVAPIALGDAIGGSLCLAYRARVGAFTAREQRLALGIADVSAAALENLRLIDNLRAANQLKSEFVSTMSHELRTPLNVILGFNEMARDVDVPARERDACLARVDSAGRELLRLVEDTLEIGRMEAGQENLKLETVRLPVLWEALHRECVGFPVAAGVALEWAAAHADVAITTDPRKLTIVVRNLVHNALKFTEQGWVRVEVRTEDQAIVLSVADTGIGIHPEDHGTIFEMFRQADGSDSRRFGGTGLGLHIVRRFVQQLGGRVALESAPGRGARFTVVLPRTRTAPSASHAA